MDDYTTLSAIYAVVRKAYAKQVYVDREFQAKTNRLVQEHIGTYGVGRVDQPVEINADTIELIKAQQGGDGTKVINLVKSIQKTAEEHSDDPFLVAMAERARLVQESFESRQKSTAEALEELLKELEGNEQRKKEQAERGFDGLTYFVFRSLIDAGIDNAEGASRKIKEAFLEHPNWRRSDKALRDLRRKVTFAIYAENDNLDEVTPLVEALFSLLDRAQRI